MKIFDLIALSARNLSRRKGRTALTVVGVAVGTCLIIVMISFGTVSYTHLDVYKRQVVTFGIILATRWIFPGL